MHRIAYSSTARLTVLCLAELSRDLHVLPEDIEPYAIHFQRLRVEQNNQTSRSERGNGYESNRLILRAFHDRRLKPRLIARDKDMRTVLQDERVLVLKRISP